MDQAFTLEDVISNAELARRPSRPSDIAAENEALNDLAQTLADSPSTVLQKLVELALKLCTADSAGISLIETTEGEALFRWNAIAGVLQNQVNGTMPRYASPCGITVDQNATQLMYLPERFFSALKVEPPVVEALLVPFRVNEKSIGTVWIVAHNDQRKFDREDERLITALARLAAAGWQLWNAQTNAEVSEIAEHESRVKSDAANEALQDKVSQGQLREEDLEGRNKALVTDITQSAETLASAKQELDSSYAERDNLEEQLRHSQKMESLGILAGGIAHDFNNLLNMIQGYVTLMRSDLREDPSKLEDDIQVIDETVKEGAALTHQLLTVARKNKVQFDPTSINSLVTTLVKWLEKTFPKTIHIELELDSSVPHIPADAHQLNQVLLNLCLNARDAMAESGILRLTTSKITGRDLQHRFPVTVNQDFVCVAVADTGAGIDEDVRQRIFEPFFTTKEQQRGSGLGLSIVYGIVSRHKGFIDVESEPGHGATFRVCLPVTFS